MNVAFFCFSEEDVLNEHEIKEETCDETMAGDKSLKSSVQKLGKRRKKQGDDNK